MVSEFRKFLWTNFARSTLSAALSSDATELFVQTGDGDKFPQPDPLYTDEIFSMVLWKADLSASEIVYGTLTVGDRITIERGKEGTTPIAFSAGDIVVHTFTAAFSEQWLIGAMTTLPVLTGVKANSDQDALLTWTEAEPADAENSIDVYQVWRSVGGAAAEFIDYVLADVLTYTDEGVFVDNPLASVAYYVVAVPLSGPTGQSNTETFPGRIPRLVAVSNALFDTDKGLMYSDDGGETWTAIVAPTSDLANDIWYSQSQQLWVTVGNAGQCWTSPDGTTWTDRSSLTGNSDAWNRVRYSPTLDLWVAVGQFGTDRAMYTDDPTSSAWTRVSSADDAEQWVSLMWSTFYEEFFSGVANDADRIQRSDDGLSWTLDAALTNGGAYELVEDGAGTIVAFTRSDTGLIYTDDGSAWTAVAAGLGAGVLSGAYSPTLDLWLISTAVRGLTSSVGIGSYTNQTVDMKNLECMVWDEHFERFVGLSVGASGISGYTEDGETWVSATTLPTGASASTWDSVAFGYRIES